MSEHSCGDYVFFDDYHTLLMRIDELEKALTICKNKGEQYYNYDSHGLCDEEIRAAFAFVYDQANYALKVKP